MAVAIRETVVTPAEGGDVVQLRISDAPLDDESATFVLMLETTVGPFENPMLTHLQRAALKAATAHLSKLAERLAADLQGQGYPAEPRPKSRA